MPDIKRPNYFTLQFLEEADFNAEQSYHRDVRHRHNLALHGWGVVGNGLRVTLTSETTGVVTVTPGVAIDREGREIILVDQRTDITDRFGSQRTLYLVIRYNAVTLEPDRYRGTGVSDQYTRFTERPEFVFTPDKPEDGSGIVLAVISLDGNGSITTIDDESERQYATSWIAPRTRLDGPLTVATDLTIEENTEIGGELNVLNSFAAQGNCSLGNADTDRINIHGILTSQHTSGALEVNDTVHVTESLNVDGNVGIGRTDPAAKLTIQTPDSFTGNLIRFESKQAPNNYHLTLNAFSPTADVVSWQLNQFNLSSDFNPVLAIDRGNIGIGTTAPTGKLTVVGSGGNGRSVTMDSNEVKFRGDRLAHFSLFANRIGRTLTIENTSSNAFPGTAGTVLMALNTTGVGIGTTTPSTRLHVQSSLGGSDTVLGSYVALIENTNADRDPLRGGDVLALKIGNIVATSQNNFITFFRGNDSIAGRIEGGGSGGDAVFVSGSGDYAEYLPRLHPEETIAPGDIVGVVAGKITKTIAGAHQVMAISDRPIVVGNMPQKDQEALYEKVAFIGQVPINVRGNVRAGDYIIPSGKNDGTGIAIAPDQITPEAYVLVVGRAWEASEEEGIKRVNTVVGLPAHYPHLEELVATVQAQQAEIEALKAELNSLKALLLQRV